MSDDAVQAKTGKTWKEWFSILDKEGARKLTHQEIVKLLNSKFNVGPWWVQTVTVTYEQHAGLRKLHEKTNGFQISVSRTVQQPLDALYDAFADDVKRTEWLNEAGLVVRRETRNKSMRVTWKDGKTSLEINFYEKGKGKSQVTVQHSKISSSTAATRMKAFWSKALDRLQATIE
jgi:hypothetical protein